MRLLEHCTLRFFAAACRHILGVLELPAAGARDDGAARARRLRGLAISARMEAARPARPVAAGLAAGLDELRRRAGVAAATGLALAYLELRHRLTRPPITE